MAGNVLHADETVLAPQLLEVRAHPVADACSMQISNGFIDVADALLVEYPLMDLQMHQEGADCFLIAFIGCSLPGYGIGTKFLGHLLELADQCRVSLVVVPAKHEPRLRVWYERLGFLSAADGAMERPVAA